MEKIKKICKCGNKFEVYPCYVNAKFCSRECFRKYRDMSWIKKTNLKKLCSCGKEFKVFPYEKDIRIFCSKICANKYRKKKQPGYKCPKGALAKMGEKNPQYGKIKDNPGRVALHSYIHKRIDKDKPKNCEHCGEEKKLEMANKSHEYKRELDDWLWLCKKCHHHYDGHEKYLEYGRKLKKKERITINCLICKNEIKVLKSSLPRKKLCSRKCVGLYTKTKKISTLKD